MRLFDIPVGRIVLARSLAVLAFAFITGLSRADLVMQQEFSDTNTIARTVLKLHGDQMRMDEKNKKIGDFSVIIDLKTRDSLTLITKDKEFLKRSGAESQQRIVIRGTPSNGTNDMDQPPAPAVDTGKSEKLDGYDTEIYTWSGARGLTETLWVATNFPAYAEIRPELAKLDQFNQAGTHRNGQPELSRLPGMVIKSENVAKGRKATVILLSAKIEPVPPALFQLPADYSPWKPAAPDKP